MRHIAILSEDADLHALLVQRALSGVRGIRCHLIAVDRVSTQLAVAWSNWEDAGFPCGIETSDGERLAPRNIDVLWWRRLNPPQLLPEDVDQPEHIRLINADSHAAVLGLFLNEFLGTWINDVTASRAAENKLVQLKAAAMAGIAVPRTIVSNDPASIRAFCRALDGEVIVKAVRGTSGFHLFTRQVTEEHLASDDCLRLSPAIYQEKVEGRTHLRLHCFGEDFLVARIDSAALDWRENIDIPFVAIDIDATLKRQVRECLDHLGLRMGVVDLKLTSAGIPVWLEVNPQGQYLFTEQLTGLDLTGRMAEFLLTTARGRQR